MVRIRMNTMRMTSVFGASAAFGLVLGAAALFCPAPAHAGDDDLPADQKFLRGVMEGLGFRRDGEETINYKERSPLVIPSGQTTGGFYINSQSRPFVALREMTVQK